MSCLSAWSPSSIVQQSQLWGWSFLEAKWKFHLIPNLLSGIVADFLQKLIVILGPQTNIIWENTKMGKSESKFSHISYFHILVTLLIYGCGLINIKTSFSITKAQEIYWDLHFCFLVAFIAKFCNDSFRQFLITLPHCCVSHPWWRLSGKSSFTVFRGCFVEARKGVLSDFFVLFVNPHTM